METFEWKGKSRDGTIKSGVIVTETSDAVIASLRAQSINPICRATSRMG